MCMHICYKLRVYFSLLEFSASGGQGVGCQGGDEGFLEARALSAQLPSPEF